MTSVALEALLVPHGRLGGDAFQLEHLALAFVAGVGVAGESLDGRGVQVLRGPEVNVGLLVDPLLPAGAAVPRAAEMTTVTTLRKDIRYDIN